MTNHRIFLIFSLSIAALSGTLLGMWMILGWLGRVSLEHFSEVLRAHAQLQVYGFVVLFTMGVALMVLPRFLGAELRPPALVPVCVGLMTGGIAVNLVVPGWVGAGLQTLSVLAFIAIIRMTRKSVPARSGPLDPLQKAHATFLATGGIWLALSPGLALLAPTKALEGVLWGFAGLYIAGIGLRVHPQILSLQKVHANWLFPVCCLWNVALVVRWLVPGVMWSLLMISAVVGLLVALNPFQRSAEPLAVGLWIRLFVRTSYLWLIVAAGFAVLTEMYPGSYLGPARHSLGSGFVLTMMIGMGFRMIPTLENRRLIWNSGPWVAYGALTVGGILRVGGQALGNYPVLGIGGALQTVSVVLFVALILLTLGVGSPNTQSQVRAA